MRLLSDAEKKMHLGEPQEMAPLARLHVLSCWDGFISEQKAALEGKECINTGAFFFSGLGLG